MTQELNWMKRSVDEAVNAFDFMKNIKLNGYQKNSEVIQRIFIRVFNNGHNGSLAAAAELIENGLVDKTVQKRLQAIYADTIDNTKGMNGEKRDWQRLLKAMITHDFDMKDEKPLTSSAKLHFVDYLLQDAYMNDASMEAIHIVINNLTPENEASMTEGINRFDQFNEIRRQLTAAKGLGQGVDLLTTSLRPSPRL